MVWSFTDQTSPRLRRHIQVQPRRLQRRRGLRKRRVELRLEVLQRQQALPALGTLHHEDAILGLHCVRAAERAAARNDVNERQRCDLHLVLGAVLQPGLQPDAISLAAINEWAVIAARDVDRAEEEGHGGAGGDGLRQGAGGEHDVLAGGADDAAAECATEGREGLGEELAEALDGASEGQEAAVRRWGDALQ